MAKQKSVELKEKIRVPRLRGAEADQSLYVSVNGKTYLIRRGMDIEVPESVAEVIRNSELAEDVAFLYAESKALKEPE